MAPFDRLLKVASVGLFGAALALAACGGGGGSSSTPSPCVTTGSVSLVYPAPNSTGIPDNFAGVIFGTASGLASSSQALLLPAGSSTYESLESIATAPSPLPSPNAIPTYASPVYQESASGGYVLPATTQIGVYYNNYGSNCTPVLIGSFTSQ